MSELSLTGQTLSSRFHVTCTRCADRQTAPHLNGSGDQCRYTDASLPVAATQSGPEASDARDWRPPGNSGKMNLRCAERRIQPNCVRNLTIASALARGVITSEFGLPCGFGAFRSCKMRVSLGERQVLIYPPLGCLGRITMSYLGNAFDRSKRAS